MLNLRVGLASALGLALLLSLPMQASGANSPHPVPIIFDTDIGNDVDDALALGVIHSLQTRQDCQLLAVTVTKDQDLSAPFVDAINTFYGRGEIPIGVVRGGVTPQPSKFTGLAQVKDDGQLRYPHDLESGQNAPDATELLRQVLAQQPDQSVVIVQVGFSTNLARLLNSPADAHSPLTGRELARTKVRLLSIMAGAFQPIDGNPRYTEYNVVEDLPSAKKLVAEWPTPIVFSGFEIGYAVRYPAVSIEQDYDYVAHHPLAEAYQLYEPTPHERPTWDLTSVLYAVFPERGYFGLSAPGRVVVEDDGFTRFVEEANGPHRYLTLDEKQQERVKESLVQLSSQPPATAAQR